LETIIFDSWYLLPTLEACFDSRVFGQCCKKVQMFLFDVSPLIHEFIKARFTNVKFEALLKKDFFLFEIFVFDCKTPIVFKIMNGIQPMFKPSLRIFSLGVKVTPF